MRQKVWVLVDSRAGNSNQAKALASLLGLKYEVKELKYNALSALPNALKNGSIELTKKTKSEIYSEKLPDIVISAGRRMASVALGIKREKPNSKIIQIMHPTSSLKYFDVLILPEHDKRPDYKFISKTILINGAICYYDKDRVDQDKKYWQKKLKPSAYPKPVIAVLIGGKSKSCNLSLDFAAKFFEQIRSVAHEKKASVLISTSRRTPTYVIEYFKKQLDESFRQPYYLYNPAEGGENPYRGFLALADYIVVTGDSISMCSEAIYTQKPTYIAYDENNIGRKHYKFINGLFAENYARPFSDSMEYFKVNNFTNDEIIKSKIYSLLGLPHENNNSKK